jgi:3-dehydroshikimate dehydratase
MAGAVGLTVAFEYHPNTLTDTDQAAVRLLTAVDHPAIGSYWQMRDGATFAQHMESLTSILPWLTHVHVQATYDGQRVPLASQADEWRRLLTYVLSAGHCHTAMLEFVRDDSPEQLLADTVTLQDLLA